MVADTLYVIFVVVVFIIVIIIIIIIITIIINIIIFKIYMYFNSINTLSVCQVKNWHTGAWTKWHKFCKLHLQANFIQSKLRLLYQI